MGSSEIIFDEYILKYGEGFTLGVNEPAGVEQIDLKRIVGDVD